MLVLAGSTPTPTPTPTHTPTPTPTPKQYLHSPIRNEKGPLMIQNVILSIHNHENKKNNCWSRET